MQPTKSPGLRAASVGMMLCCPFAWAGTRNAPKLMATAAAATIAAMAPTIRPNTARSFLIGTALLSDTLGCDRLFISFPPLSAGPAGGLGLWVSPGPDQVVVDLHVISLRPRFRNYIPQLSELSPPGGGHGS